MNKALKWAGAFAALGLGSYGVWYGIGKWHQSRLPEQYPAFVQKYLGSLKEMAQEPSLISWSPKLKKEKASFTGFPFHWIFKVSMNQENLIRQAGAAWMQWLNEKAAESGQEASVQTLIPMLASFLKAAQGETRLKFSWASLFHSHTGQIESTFASHAPVPLWGDLDLAFEDEGVLYQGETQQVRWVFSVGPKAHPFLKGRVVMKKPEEKTFSQGVALEISPSLFQEIKARFGALIESLGIINLNQLEPIFQALLPLVLESESQTFYPSSCPDEVVLGKPGPLSACFPVKERRQGKMKFRDLLLPYQYILELNQDSSYMIKLSFSKKEFEELMKSLERQWPQFKSKEILPASALKEEGDQWVLLIKGDDAGMVFGDVPLLSPWASGLLPKISDLLHKRFFKAPAAKNQRMGQTSERRPWKEA